MLCSKCGSDQHATGDCGAIGAGTGAPGTGPDDSDLAAIDDGGGSGVRSFFKRPATLVILGIIGVVAIVAGVIAMRGGSDKATKAVATATAAKPPTGDEITLGCSIPSVGEEEVEARCEWAKDGGVSFANLRWDGDVLKGTLVVTLTDGRTYRSEKEMVVKAQKAKTPVTFLAQK